MEWKFYSLDRAVQRRTGSPSAVRVATFARRVMGIRRARAQRRKPTDLLALLRGRRGQFFKSAEKPGEPLAVGANMNPSNGHKI